MCDSAWYKLVCSAAAEQWRGLSIVKVRIHFGQPRAHEKVGEL